MLDENLKLFCKNHISLLVVMISSLLILLALNSSASPVLAVENDQKPDINAANVYQTHKMILGNNIKNLVILIPDEAHESMNQPKNQLPLINQPYVPQNATVNVGTTVTWFHSDVDHKHTITLNDKNSGNNVFKTKPFLFNTATQPFAFNKTGSFDYFEKNVNNQDPKFVMDGTITVVNQPSPLSNVNNSKQISNNNTNTNATIANTTSSSSSATTTTAKNIDTVGTFMVPAKDLDKHKSELEKAGILVDSTFTYKDARGGQKGTGKEQALVVWKSAGMDLDKVLSSLKKITPTLPYS